MPFYWDSSSSVELPFESISFWIIFHVFYVVHLYLDEIKSDSFFAFCTAILLLLLCRDILSISLNFIHLLSMCSSLIFTLCFPITSHRKNIPYLGGFSEPRLTVWHGQITFTFSQVSSIISR
ncbi:MAG: hypothetical protein WCG25_02760 [bacterium]